MLGVGFDILSFLHFKTSFAIIDMHAGAANKLALDFMQGKNKNGKEGSVSSGSRHAIMASAIP